MKISLLVSVLMLSFGLGLFAKGPQLSYEQLIKPPSKIIRKCCSFGSDVSVARIPFVKKNDIIDVEELGKHQYLSGPDEANGIIYTHKGGFIDVGHLRDCADWTAYIFTLLQSEYFEDEILLDLGKEGGPKSLTLYLSKIEGSTNILELAACIAYDLSLWHEIATWFGASYIPLIPEKFSSFSPEDLYSNLLGVKIGIQAILSELPYEEAMTLLIKEKIQQLDAVASGQDTYEAFQKVENIWWNGNKALPSSKLLLKRYLDDDYSLFPWLLPEDQLNYQPFELIKPSDRYNDCYELQIKLNGRFPFDEFDEFSEDKIVTQDDFSWLMDYIEIDQMNTEKRYSEKQAKQKSRKEK